MPHHVPFRVDRIPVAAALAAAFLWTGCAPPGEAPMDADEFVRAAEAELLEVVTANSRIDWVQATHITEDTDALAAAATERTVATQVRLAKEAAGYDAEAADTVTARKLGLLKTAITLPAPSDDAKRAELTRITTSLQSRYGSGRYCPEGATGEECLSLGELEDVIDTSRNPRALEDAWVGWRTVSAPMRGDFARYVELANEGARELGYTDLGAMWRSKYDMPADEFAAELDRLWDQVRPLYEQLHCHVRARLAEEYGEELVPADEPIPAHLLGNMWSQTWSNIEALVAPQTEGPGYDLTARLREEDYDAVSMVRAGEAFFTSLGLEELPETFWTRSQFTKPRDREVVCHASAWAVDWEHDLRIKMCIDVNAEDFSTIHHELGHNVYQAAYRDQDLLFRDSANDGFHEALGDTVALSITPAYLEQIGLIDEEPPASADLGLLMRMALDKIAFLPFGLLVDQYRWKVFSGEIGEGDYNQGWWRLREQYQGIRPPVERSEADFDAGAKYHVAANVSYTRYFLAHILQFQFHRDLCEAIGYEGPLNRCSIYGNEEAGRRLEEMMAMGTSRPWQDALESLTGSREMDATAILDYFAPLQSWLEEQNADRACGW